MYISVQPNPDFSNLSRQIIQLPTLYQKSDLCIPRNETDQPRYQILPNLPIWLQIGNLILEILSLTDT
jgi:hypothetical protein